MHNNSLNEGIRRFEQENEFLDLPEEERDEIYRANIAERKDAAKQASRAELIKKIKTGTLKTLLAVSVVLAMKAVGETTFEKVSEVLSSSQTPNQEQLEQKSKFDQFMDAVSEGKLGVIEDRESDSGGSYRYWTAVEETEAGPNAVAGYAKKTTADPSAEAAVVDEIYINFADQGYGKIDSAGERHVLSEKSAQNMLRHYLDLATKE